MTIFLIFLLLPFALFSDIHYKVEPISGKINTDLQEFGPSIGPDGKNLYFYSKRNGSKYTDIFRSINIDGTWREPMKIYELNSPYDDQSPFISEDGKFMIFSSNRDGSKEFRLEDGRVGVSRDIYYSELAGVRWTKPVPLSDKINTNDIEENPFLVGNEFYFTRYPFGEPNKAKIYRAKIVNDQLGEPESLPYPINVPNYSSLAAIISIDKKEIYFSSNRPGGYGGYDIYKSIINENGQYSEPINLGSEINTNGDEAYLVINRADNSFVFCRKEIGKSYDIYTAKPIEKQEIAQILKTHKKITLNSIHFKSNSSDITSESTTELDKVIEYMEKNKSLKLKIIGHTDLTGDLDFNQILSEHRALSVKNYFVKKGIDEKRMAIEGKGSTTPVENNMSEESNKKNRRTEFQILDKE